MMIKWNIMSISLDRVTEDFDRTRGLPQHVMNKILKTLKEELEEYKRILDVGVGTGRFSKPLQDAGFEVVGVDVSKKFLGKAYERGTEDLIVGDACSLPFQDSTFDASISVGTLHLIAEWKSALREIVRVTIESLFTVHYSTPEYGRTPSGVYKAFVEKHGYSCRHPGLGEWKLKEIIKSTKSRFVTSYDVSTDERVAFLSEKAFSYQWNVPEDLHEEAVEELGKIFAGKKEYAIDVYVHRLDISEIKNYLES
jgi:ubiquinone/menaquinone biosynthesis C-methylase UbiE